jgi:hypothetical protein
MLPLVQMGFPAARDTAASPCFERKPDVTGRTLVDRTILLNATTGNCFELNAVGSAIWATLDGSRSWEQISAEVARRFAVTGEQADLDVQRFATDLVAADLIRPAAA